MTSRHWLCAALAGASFSLAVAVAVAAPQVVGDEACARYAVDIESFATCEDGRVVRPQAASESAAARGVPVALQVVGDEACVRHAVDIEAFATCDGGRVARPAAAAVAAIPLESPAAQRSAASPFAPDARHREAWLRVAAVPGGRATNCDDGLPVAPMAVAQRW